MRPLRAFLLTSATFLGTSLLYAQDNFPAYDRNNNGVITRDEWEGTMRDFRSRDINRDGVLSGNELPRGWRDSDEYSRRTEYSRGTEPQRHRQFSRWDRNGDDVIQRHEWRGDMATFRQHDLNRDGRITWHEYSNQTAVGEGTRARTQRLDKNNSGAVEGYEWPYNRELFHQLDRDANSVLTEDELRNMSQATLSQLDRNKNGQIDSSEWPGGFATFRDLDQDGDGRVTSSEYFDRGGNWQRRQRFQSWDKNGDGIIQSTEWQNEPALFHRLDTNANSQIEWEEFHADTERYLTPRRW
jgi:Ca2+-binding EF-hand superfamily protein